MFIAIEFFFVDAIKFLSMRCCNHRLLRANRAENQVIRQRDSTRPSNTKAVLERVAHRLRIGFAASRLHHLTHEPAQHAGLRFGLLGLVRIGCDDRIDRAVDCASVGHLTQTVRFDQRARISAAVISE